jgi:hypothetical protein
MHYSRPFKPCSVCRVGTCFQVSLALHNNEELNAFLVFSSLFIDRYLVADRMMKLSSFQVNNWFSQNETKTDYFITFAQYLTKI